MRKPSLLTLITTTATVVALGCGGPPPLTAEMQSFEQMRNESYASAVAARFPELTADADKHYKASEEAHDSGDDAMTLHHARMANMLWMTAVYQSQGIEAQVDAEKSAKATDAANGDLATATAERDRLAESVTRLQRISELEGKVVAQQSQASAQSKLDASLVVIKEAEAVDAGKYAPELLARAKKAYDAGGLAMAAKEYATAGRQADVAAQAANDAKDVAKPLHDAEAAKHASQDEQEALFALAKGVTKGTASITARGVTIVLPEMFKKRETIVSPEFSSVLDQVSSIAKKFDKTNLIIEAHTDTRGGDAANLSLSQGRADAVFTSLTERQISPSRLTAVGKGSSEPIADNRTNAGRAQNRRFVIVFVRTVQ